MEVIQEISRFIGRNAITCDSLRDDANSISGGEGIRTPLEIIEKSAKLNLRDAIKGAHWDQDADLTFLINSWRKLTPSIKAAIMAMARFPQV